MPIGDYKLPMLLEVSFVNKKIVNPDKVRKSKTIYPTKLDYKNIGHFATIDADFFPFCPETDSE